MKQKFVVILMMLLIVGCGTQPSVENPAADANAQTEVVAEALPVNVDITTVENLRDREDVILIDVREDWEYEAGHIPGATLIPLGDIPNRLNEIPKDKTVIAVCRSGNRSGQATQFLQQQGFDNIHNMQGGMLAWEQANYEVE